MTNDKDQVEQILRDAEIAATAEDWDRTIALYRQLLAFDRVIQGAEAKLQWALRMKEIETWYQQGQAHLRAQRYNDALTALRKARLMYASHYKNTDQLIVEAQTAMQKENWQARPRATAHKGCFLFGGLIALLALMLAACAAPTTAPAPTSIAIPTAAAAPTAQPTEPPRGDAGRVAQLPPARRVDMYKSAPQMRIDVNKLYVATIKTAKGNIVVEMYPKDAPLTVNNFVLLAREGFYDGLTFHRVEPNFVIQGGDPKGDGTGGPGYTIPAEIKIKHTKGAIAMARLGDQQNPRRESSGSQFYITLEATPFLDGAYTAFGQVTQGMDVVAKIGRGDVIQSVTIEEK
jgi:cyclophilin family peptidyl-prolyl cis-trans isomerase